MNDKTMKPEDPKRYDFQGAVSEQGHLYARAVVKQSGKWVKFEDYEALRTDLSLALAREYAADQHSYTLEDQLEALRSASIDEHAKEASTRIGILTAQLKGQRRLIQTLQDELRETMAERDKLAGIGIECGCGEASCTADADNLRDALAQIRRLKNELNSLRASSFVTAVPCDVYEKLKDENELLRKTSISLYMEFEEFGQVSNSSIYALRDAAKGGKPTK